MQGTQVQQSVTTNHISEEILVVPRAAIFANMWPWYGIQPSVFEKYTDIISKNAAFMPRAHAETNSAYKQIIPYMLFSHKSKLFVMQRKQTASEQRLASKFSLGIGGHIRQEDIVSNNILHWAMREFQEEVTYTAPYTSHPLGVLNDDTSDVGKVHLGMILLIQGDSDQIKIQDEHKSGMLMTIDECKGIYDQMENWSKICFDYIIQNPNLIA